MKVRILIARVIAVFALCFGLVSLQPAANAVPENPSVAQSVNTGANGFAMGGYPNYWTLCVANGYGPTAGVINNWNDWGFRLHIAVQNHCDGYSITNRMTIDSQNAPGAACLEYNNTHKTWSPARGKYIWDQNPIIWVNTAPGCFDNNTELYHNIQKGVGYVLGLGYNPNQCLCIMGSNNYDTNNIPYVTYGDVYDVTAGVGY